MKANIKILLVLAVLSFLLGCTYRPTEVLLVHKVNDVFLIATTEDIIFVDAQTHKTLNSVKMPSKIYQVIPDEETLIAKLYGPYDKAPVYRIHMTGQAEEIGHMVGYFSKLIDVDDEYIYILTSELKSIRLNKQTNSFSDGHFDAYPDLMIVDIWVDEDYYWYACLQEGALNLVQKDKHDGTLKMSPIENGPYRSVFLTGDSALVWLFAISNDHKSNVIEISKKDNTVSINKLEKMHSERAHAWLMPLPQEGQKQSTKYLWAVDENYHLSGKLYRLALESFTMDEFSTPTGYDKTAKASNFPVFSGYPKGISSPLYSNEENIWVGAVIPHSWRDSRHTGQPHLIKLSKDTMQHETFAIEQTFARTIGNIFINIKDLSDDFFAPEILIGFILCVFLMSIFFVVMHRITKRIVHPFLSAVMASVVFSLIAVVLLLFASSGEGGLVIIAVAPSLFIGFIIGGLVIALIYKKIVKK